MQICHPERSEGSRWVGGGVYREMLHIRSA